jgi:choline dehydrogenase-like flavoprotein
VSDDRQYDVIIIGTGAGGGTLAHRLAPSGKRVLLLERGDYLPRERDNWDSTAVFVRGKYRAPEFWYNRNGDEFPREVNYYVGGNTKFYGAALFRLRPEDFGELRHHGGISPAWPIGYAELEHYSMAEHLYLVHGRHGEDPTAGPTSADYRYPPMQHEPRIQQLSDDLEKTWACTKSTSCTTASIRTRAAHRRNRAPGRHRALRHRPTELGTRRELQGTRTRQPLRRRHQLLPEHRRRQPIPHRHRQRPARRRPPDRTTRMTLLVR